MDKTARIRHEIERRRLHFNKEAEKYQALNNGYSQNCYGARDALRDLENFLDTLPEEPELVRHPPIAYTYPSDASRDEQLKMALLALLNSDLIKVAGNKFTKQDLIDWVEKQKGQKPVETSDFKTKLAEYLQNNSPKDGQYVISSESILEMAEEELIKRGVVQKPAEWSEEDEKASHFIAEYLERLDRPTAKSCLEWLNNRLKFLCPQSKQEKSNYITPHKEFFRWIYNRLINVHKEDPNMDYMISFKKRIEELSFEEPSWSEEDEKMLVSFLHKVEVCDLLTNKEYAWIVKRLKSFRPSWKPSEVCYGAKGDPDPAGVWKPSEEQMEALEECGECKRCIKELYEQLKKLM